MWRLPGALRESAVLEDDVNFAPADRAADADEECTGTAEAPTAPPGKVCLYVVDGHGTRSRCRASTANLRKQGFTILFDALAGTPESDRLAWQCHLGLHRPLIMPRTLRKRSRHPLS